MTDDQAKETMVKAIGYQLVSRECFEALTPEDMNSGVDEAKALLGLKARVAAIPGAYVLYDPNDDGEGWLLVGDSKEALATETLNHFDIDDT